MTKKRLESAAKGKVLIIDDSRFFIAKIKSVLKKENYELFSAETGQRGIELAEVENPHLVLLDVNLPDMLGYEVCAALKRNPSTEDIPLLFISGHEEIEEKVKGLELGAMDFITKPINARILATKVRTFVQLCRSHREILLMKAKLDSANSELVQFSQALANANDGILLTDPQGNVTYANRAFSMLCNKQGAKIRISNISTFFEKSDALEEAKAKALHDDSVQQEITMLVEHGQPIPVLLRCSPITGQAGDASGLLFMVTDLTPQKRLEKERERLELELFHSQKLESVGQLAAGIAHEINTPIQFVGDNIRFLKDASQDLLELQEIQSSFLEQAREQKVDPGAIKAVEEAIGFADIEYLAEEMPKAIDQSLEGVTRVSSIVRAMKEFAHPGTTEMSHANINEAIATTITVARNKWKYDAEIEIDFDENLPMVECLIGELNQVVLNLIVNAADAIHDNRGETGPLGQIKIQTRAKGKWAEISVSDTGGGIPGAIQEKVFDPFFTTKDVGRGSGQGLAIARSVILNKHNGEFTFETEEGVGTTFIVRLPIKRENVESNGD